jgi:hypothetical protein
MILSIAVAPLKHLYRQDYQERSGRDKFQQLVVCIRAMRGNSELPFSAHCQRRRPVKLNSRVVSSARPFINSWFSPAVLASQGSECLLLQLQIELIREGKQL